MDRSPPGSSVRGINQTRILDGFCFLLQGIFLTQGSNPHLLHLWHRQALLYWSVNNDSGSC